MRRSKVIFLLIFNLISLINSIVIELENGLVEGVTLRTRKNQNFYAFRKIPYAKPPIGDLRFKDPIEVGKWNGILNATEYGSYCTQVALTRYGYPKEWQGMVFGEENCLHLNVFTRTLSSGVLKPVIVWIHGGGFEVGTAVTYQPNMLMDRDVVVVSLNYRLGPFGFLALGTADAPGNYGLKDQNLALKWIQKNIQRFDGDPNKVTITGCSAGGYSATAHMLSEMSRGLFHGVIALSGAITWQKRLNQHQRGEAQELARNAGCPTNLNTMVECLREKTAEELAKAQVIDFHSCPILPWVPVVEPNFGQERFLTAEPNILFEAGNFTRVPVMTGITNIEFADPIAQIFNSTEATRLLNEDFPNFASKCFFYEETRARSLNSIAYSIRSHYLPEVDKITQRNFNSLNLLSADSVIGYNTHRFVHFTSRFIDVFYYKFSFSGRFSVFYYPREKPYGVHHADDVHYIFTVDYIGPQISESDPENVMVERMTRIWENFARTGNPNNFDDEFLSEMKWPKHNLSDEFYLDIGTFLVEKQGMNLERYAVWDSFERNSGGKLRFEWMMMIVMVTLGGVKNIL